jgi:glucose/arabinose dehydrogenase
MAVGVSLTGCSSQDHTASTAPVTGMTTSQSSPSATSGAASNGLPAPPSVRVIKTLAARLLVPWGVAFLPDGSALVGERPTGRVLRIGRDGGTTPVGVVPGVANFGEGGLLGLAVQSGTSQMGSKLPFTVYAYLTSTVGDNRVVRMTFDGTRLGAPTPVLIGIPSADHHDGGLVKIGPDGKLWIGTGDAGQSRRAQDRSNLGGKILRINLDGSIPADNPFPGSPVYSMGHRNVQGLAFDSSKQPWAIEFGQHTWDELNRIVPGGNYGWPVVEGKGRRPGFIDPLVQWPVSEASPSGMAIVGDVAYIGALRGQRLWQVPLHGTATGTPKPYLIGTFGRIRNVTAAPGGALWITTSNRDGRQLGRINPTDDRVIVLTVS